MLIKIKEKHVFSVDKTFYHFSLDAITGDNL